MIKKQTTQETNQASNRILAGTHIEGEISSDGDVRVDGTLKGTINIKGKLVVGENGVVEGEINCQFANVSGTLKGNLKVHDLLTLQKSARLHGDIITAKLSVESGAEFSGSCKMGAVVRELGSGEEQSAETRKEKAL